MPRLKHVFILIVFALILGCGNETPSSAGSFPVMNGDQLASAIEQGKGRVVVVNFWATWCNPCRMELGELTQLREKYSQDQLLLMGLSVDEGLDDLRAFFGAKSMNYPIYHAGAGAAASYGVRGVPHFLVFDKTGRLAYNNPGFLSLAQLSGAVDELLSE